MKNIVPLLLSLALSAASQAETAHERGKRVVNEALQAMGGQAYLAMQDLALKDWVTQQRAKAAVVLAP